MVLFIGLTLFASDSILKPCLVGFQVVIPEDTPDSASVFITGSIPLLGEWNHKEICQHNQNGIYRKEITVDSGSLIEYKYSLGSWNTVEKSKNQHEIENRRITIEKDTVIHDTVANWSITADTQGSCSGTIRYHDNFYSPELENSRTIMIYLPPGYYQDTSITYPVLYMHDGNNLFDQKTSFTHVEWQVDEIAERLIGQNEIVPLIIVGIYNNSDRANEYTPYKDEEYQLGGKGDLYLQFITKTLKTFIDHHYRTMPSREHTCIGGSSLGGLISVYAAIKYPEYFGQAMIISPAIWWSTKQIIREIDSCGFKLPVKLWIDIGTREGTDKGRLSHYVSAVQDCRELITVITKKGLKAGKDYHYEEIEAGIHHEKAWSERFNRILKYFYSP